MDGCTYLSTSTEWGWAYDEEVGELMYLNKYIGVIGQ